jgi:hypothetical protein
MQRVLKVCRNRSHLMLRMNLHFHAQTHRVSTPVFCSITVPAPGIWLDARSPTAPSSPGAASFAAGCLGGGALQFAVAEAAMLVPRQDG